jgi:hypothetical protein
MKYGCFSISFYYLSLLYQIARRTISGRVENEAGAHTGVSVTILGRQSGIATSDSGKGQPAGKSKQGDCTCIQFDRLQSKTT